MPRPASARISSTWARARRRATCRNISRTPARSAASPSISAAAPRASSSLRTSTASRDTSRRVALRLWFGRKSASKDAACRAVQRGAAALEQPPQPVGAGSRDERGRDDIADVMRTDHDTAHADERREANIERKETRPEAVERSRDGDGCCGVSRGERPEIGLRAPPVEPERLVGEQQLRAGATEHELKQIGDQPGDRDRQEKEE